MAIPKYKNKKIMVNGIQFDSKKEAKRYQELKLMEDAGMISRLERQVEFVLIPEQREFNAREIYTKGPKKGSFKPGKLLERKLVYIADFVYMKDGKVIVEDVKGYRDGGAYRVFVIKRKLMLYRFGLKVVEI